MSPTFHFRPIGFIESPCKEKFALPRQAALVPELTARIIIEPEFCRAEAFAELDGFSHLWIISVFHQAVREQWQPMVRPPRLGGNTRVGVFASRAPYRPNPIGISAVELIKIEIGATPIRIWIAGCDLADGTPVLDIKPYLPYADAFPHASPGYTAESKSNLLDVNFSAAAQQACQALTAGQATELQQLIVRLIQQDPRPAYIQADTERKYAFRLYEFDVIFHVEGARAIVEALVPRT